MTLPELYDHCRDINRYLAFAAFCWISLRTARAWPAEWAKPDHVGHYRSILLLVSSSMLTLTMGAYLSARASNPATAGSAVATIVCIACILICARWPKPRKMRKD